MRPAADVRGSIARFGVFEVDLSRGELRREGRRVSLQRHSFLVLATLVERAGEEVSRETLRAQLWPGVEFLDFENGINSAVARLRQALHDSAESPRFIATRRGCGYRLLAPVTWVSPPSPPVEKEPAASPSGPSSSTIPRVPRRPSARVAWSALLVAVGLIALVGGWLRSDRWPGARTSALAGPESSFPVYAPPGQTLTGSFALSPDGRQLVLVVGGDGEACLWLRSLDGVAEHRLPGTEGAAMPFWAPGGKAVGFFAHGNLQTIDLLSGRVAVLAPAPRARGGTWNADGTILFAPHLSSDIWSISAAGGRPVAVTDRAGAASHRFPAFLPDGRHFLYLVLRDDRQASEIWWGRLGSGETGRLIASSANALCTAHQIVFARGSALFAQEFDHTTLRTIGSPVMVADGVGVYGEEGPTGLGAFSVSADGGLAVADVLRPELRFAWFDRSGRRQEEVGPAGDFVSFDLSPDDTRIAAVRFDVRKRSSDILTINLTSGVQTEVTDDPWPDATVAWAPTGSRLAFVSLRAGVWTAVVRDTARGDGEQQLGSSFGVDGWFPDGEHVLCERASEHEAAGMTLAQLSVASRDAQPVPLVEGASEADPARLSPDGKWLAYALEAEPEHNLHLVRLAPRTPGVVLGVGSCVRWRRDGRELFFLSAGHLMRVGVGTAGPLGAAQRLFDPPLPPHDSLADYPLQFGVSADGSRFLFPVPIASQPGSAIHVIPGAARPRPQ